MEQIEEIVRDGGGNVTEIQTKNYRFVFPEDKRPVQDSNLQKSDYFAFVCHDHGGTSAHPRALIMKPGVQNPIYSAVVPKECISKV
ncbi:MAG TPA: hypothetical protein VK254_04515 [Candidatus Bathyarchaeia archaeon]|nr:hypothetical protein [Candidatus Bathyarchaeia archaeon]